MREDYGLITAKKILATPETPFNWIVHNLLPVGLAVISGPPKSGKSYLGLNIAWAVASGGKLFNHFAIDEGRSLYVSYESNIVAMKERLLKISRASGAPDSVLSDVFFYKNNVIESKGPDLLGFKRIDDGGPKIIREAIVLHPDISLVIIDSLDTAFYPKIGNYGNTQHDITCYWSVMQRYAFQQNICLLFLRTSHAPRRQELFDPLLARADVNLTFESKVLPDKSLSGRLSAIGRDIPRASFPLHFDPATGIWEHETCLEQGNLSLARKQVAELLASAPDTGMCISDIAAALRKSRQNISKLLRKMQFSGLVAGAGYGKYRLAKLQ